MNKAQALLALIEALSHIGIGQEELEIAAGRESGDELFEQRENDDLVVTLRPYQKFGANVVVTVSENFWRYPGVACYFVNYDFGGDFSCAEGTPHLHRALFCLGAVVEMANAKKLKDAA
jgi:hypothetical protein